MQTKTSPGDGGGGVFPGLVMVAKATAAFLGASFAVGFLTPSLIRYSITFKKDRHGRLCWSCRGVGYYPCKLCKGNGTIEWSPMYDPIFKNPCVCPTCDGFKVQKCLNCLGNRSVG